jgi:hypothetical protein
LFYLIFAAIFAPQLLFPLIIIVAGIIGHIDGRVAPEKFAAGGGHGKAGKKLWHGDERPRDADTAMCASHGAVLYPC